MAKKKFILKFIAVIMPVIFVLWKIEFNLSKMQTNYRAKREGLEGVLPEVELLVTGSSNSYYGINPKYFDLNGYNIAYRAQSHYYDLEIIRRYLNKMKNLKMVLIPFIYLTFGTEQEDLSDTWRMFFYDQYYSIPYSPSTKRKLGWSYWIDPRRFSKIALFGERTIGFVRNNFKDKIDDVSSPNGWFDAGNKPMDPSLAIGLNGGHAHNLAVDTSRYADNIQHVDELVRMLLARGITPVLLQLPLHREITDYMDKKKFDLMDKVIGEFAQRHQIKYRNYVYDQRFTGNDFTDMPDHLNAKGAEKISRILNDELVRPVIDNNRLRSSRE